MRRRTLLAAAAGLAGPALAMDAPTGPVVLNIAGRITLANGGTPGARLAQFDMGMLERLPTTSFSTRTPWYAQARRFSGPLLRDVLAAVGAQGPMVRALALNDYRVDIPVDDARRWDVIVARLIDERPMTVRDKGPLFIMYPFDRHAELRTPLYYSRCAWQLRALEVL
ncbi:MAG: hypothetical protein ACKVQR_02565 [Aquabacterium sp.]